MKSKGAGGRREDHPLPSVLGGAQLTCETPWREVTREKAVMGDMEAEELKTEGGMGGGEGGGSRSWVAGGTGRRAGC